MEKMGRRGKKQVYSLLVVLLFLTGTRLWGQFAGGSGTQADPYRIETAVHLNNVRNYLGPDNVNVYFRQDADIDLGVAPWNEEEGWVPIGSGGSVGEPQPTTFYGIYDGNGKIIRNLTINRPAANDQALFGGLDTGSVIRRLGLIDVNIVGQNNVAGLVAVLPSGTVEQCFVTGSITGRTIVGGINGRKGANYGSATIRNCYSTAHVRGTMGTTSTAVGGITGNQYRGTSQNCLAVGLVEVIGQPPSEARDGALGGNQGHTGATSFAGSFWDNATTRQLRDTSMYVVGLRPGSTTAALVQQATFTADNWDFNNIWAIDQLSSYPYFQWEGDEPGDHSIPNYLPPTELTSTIDPETVNLRWIAPPPALCVPDGYNIYRDGVRVNPAGEPVQNTEYSDRGLENDRRYTYTVTAVYDDGEVESLHTFPVNAVPLADPPAGSGTEDDPYRIWTVDQLNNIRHQLDPNRPVYFQQTAHLDLEGHEWEMIEDFNGIYDGRFHTISGLTINTNATAFAQIGLFYNTRAGAEIRNLGMINVNIRHTATAGAGSHAAGAITGAAVGTLIENCYATGFVRGRRNGIGMLVGRATGGTVIRNCYSTGRAESNHTDGGVGGLVGYTSNARIENSYSTASAHNLNTASSTNGVGGLLGWMGNASDRIINSYATGAVTAVAPTAIGGLVGRHQAGQVIDSFWNRQTTGQDTSPGGGTGLTTDQMIRQATFTEANWEFPMPWNIQEGQTYPYFAYQRTPGHHNIPGPAGLVATARFEVSEVALEWLMPAEPVRFNIYRNNVRIAQNDGDDREFVDRQVPFYQRFTYHITAVFLDDHLQEFETAPSNSAVVTLAHFSGGDGTEENPFQVRIAQHLENVSYNLNAHYIQVDDIAGEFTRLSDSGNRFTGTYDGQGFTISGLDIDDSSFGSGGHQGLFGYIDGATLKNIHLIESTIIRFRPPAGLLVGHSENSTISGCSAVGSIQPTDTIGADAGGLIGTISGGIVTDSWSDVEMTVSNRYIGGFVGRVLGGAVIERCYALGYVTNNRTGLLHTGGFVGRLDGGTINDCYARGNVIGTRSLRYLGGFIGEPWIGNINRCYSTGIVRCDDENIELNNEVGGFAGRDRPAVPMVNCYWDVEASQFDYSQGGEGRTTAQMTYRPDLYADFPHYHNQTYIEWGVSDERFNNDIWHADTEYVFQEDPQNIRPGLNFGYPVFFYQLVPPDALDTPEVTIRIFRREEEPDIVRLDWEAIPGANSYKIYSFDSADAIPFEQWGQPIIRGQNWYETEIEQEEFAQFFRVIASGNMP